jgi:hypothetical protein
MPRAERLEIRGLLFKALQKKQPENADWRELLRGMKVSVVNSWNVKTLSVHASRTTIQELFVIGATIRL